jgi:filamentous hemagglutinin
VYLQHGFSRYAQRILDIYDFNPGATLLKLADVANRVIIDARKLTSYALNPDSPKGKYKALLFDKLLGFNRENYVDLIR